MKSVCFCLCMTTTYFFSYSTENQTAIPGIQMSECVAYDLVDSKPACPSKEQYMEVNYDSPTNMNTAEGNDENIYI